MAFDDAVSITFVYSPQAGHIHELTLVLPQGTRADMALKKAAELTEIDNQMLDNPLIGVWGKKVQPGHILRAGDRLELYRPLLVDPKVARRERFVRQGSRKVPGLFASRRPGGKAGY